MKSTCAGLLLVAFLLAADSHAAQFQTLWSFSGVGDGGSPSSGLVLAGDGALYGTTPYGGTNGYGTVYRITTNGVLTTLWSFSGDDGDTPFAGLIKASDGALYGTTAYGGGSSVGTIFKITTNGVLTTLWSFTYGDDGGYPRSALVQGGDGALYGTSTSAGTNSLGTIFKITTNGVLSPMWSFTGSTDGVSPDAGLVQGTDGAFYGTARLGGSFNLGSIFRITTNGAFTPLWQFAGNEGSKPQSALVQAGDGTLYGGAYDGGSNAIHGSLFHVTTNGTFTRSWSFAGGADGRRPSAQLLPASDGALYGTATSGGTNFEGTIFRVTTSGAFSPVWSFRSASDGLIPQGNLVQIGGALYGTTSSGGTNGNGTVFRIAIDSLQSSPSGYDIWAAGITNGMTAFNQSATGDGYPNLLKYFTGSSPTTPDSVARLTSTLTNGYFDLQFNWNTSAVDVTAIAEGSYSIESNALWTGIATNSNGSWGGSTNVIGISAGTPAVVTVRDTAPLATNRFLRLRVIRP